MSTHSGTLRALLVQHERATPGGLIRTWLDEQSADIDELRIDVEDREVDPRGYELIVSLGSEFAAYDDTLPFVQRETRLLRQAIGASVPVLGVCFGGQLLARVLGGHAIPAPQAEIGWLPVRSRDLALVPTGPWFQWHFDSFTIPPGATLIAESNVSPQAYVFERCLGLQFHPEVTPEIVDGWIRSSRHELDAVGVDPDALLRETEQRVPDTRHLTWRLLRRYLDSVAQAGRPGDGVITPL